MVTHDQEVAQMARRRIEIRDGLVREVGTVSPSAPPAAPAQRDLEPSTTPSDSVVGRALAAPAGRTSAAPLAASCRAVAGGFRTRRWRCRLPAWRSHAGRSERTTGDRL